MPRHAHCIEVSILSEEGTDRTVDIGVESQHGLQNHARASDPTILYLNLARSHSIRVEYDDLF